MKFKKINDCTLLIITHERDKLLNKSINFYRKFFSKIQILDSSKKKKKFKKKNCEYFHCRDYSLVKKVLFGLSRTKTDFVLISPDDDFFIPTSIKKGIKFLKNNLDFISCGGKYFYFEKVYMFKKFKIIYKNNYKSILHNNPSDRLKDICMRSISQMTYNLFRTEKIYKGLSQFKYFKEANFLENSITLTSILFGKHKFMDINWMIRDGLVNTKYGYKKNIVGLIKNNSKSMSLYLKKFKSSFSKTLKNNSLKVENSLINKYLNSYFYKTKNKKNFFFKENFLIRFLKKIYKIFNYGIFFYTYFFFFKKNERKIISLIFK
jgi:glycosyltransferase domain-containing protein